MHHLHASLPPPVRPSVPPSLTRQHGPRRAQGHYSTAAVHLKSHTEAHPEDVGALRLLNLSRRAGAEQTPYKRVIGVPVVCPVPKREHCSAGGAPGKPTGPNTPDRLCSCVCLPAAALLAQETFCLPHVSPVCFYLSCHESVICTNNIQSTVNTKHTTFPIRWENSAGEWERQPGTHARKAALQPPTICVEAPPQPNPTIIVNVPWPEPAEPECSQKRRFPYVE